MAKGIPLMVMLLGFLACGGGERSAPEPGVTLIDPTTRQAILSRIRNPGYEVSELKDDGENIKILLLLPPRPVSERRVAHLATEVCENVTIYLATSRYRGRGVEVLVQQPDTLQPERLIPLGRSHYDPGKNEIRWEGLGR